MADGMAIGGIDADGVEKGGKADYLAKLKKYQEQFQAQAGNWTNGYNVNQLPGLLNGQFSTTASQG